MATLHACNSFLNGKIWTQCEDASEQIRRSADAVTDGNKVYIRPSHVKKILVFDLVHEIWDDTKFECNYYRSSLVIINNQLIAVGGTENMGVGSECCKDLMLISAEGNREWAEMQHPRSRCTAIPYQHEDKKLLIVAGGENPVRTTLTTVEILHITTTSTRPMIACSLPDPLYSCSAAIVRDHLYLLGGWHECQKATNKVYRCSISSLYESCTSQSDVHAWETLDADAPAAQTTCIAFQGKLLTFGGTWCYCYACTCGNKPTKNIYQYDEENEEFKCIGSTPKAQYLCLACTADSTIFIAGGAENDEEALKDVHILKT